jgi:hypothetical protein
MASNVVAATACTGLPFKAIAQQIYTNLPDGLWVVLSSCLLFLSGMIWNDLADVERDRSIAPKRPLPSGRISYTVAWFVGVILASGALLAAAQLGWRGFYGAGVVLALALGYNFAAKHLPWIGSLVMALTRSAHAVFALLLLGPDYFDRVVLGLADTVGAIDAGPTIAPPVYPILIGIYIFGLTIISELEHRASYRWELLLAGGIITLGMVGALAQTFTGDFVHALLLERKMALVIAISSLAVSLAVWLGWRLLVPWMAAVRHAKRRQIPGVVIAGLGGILLFDAIVVAAFQPLFAIAILFLLPIFMVLGRAIRMN